MMPSPLNRVALWATCVLVLAPTTLGALVLTLLGLWGMASVPIVVLLAAGWFGILVLWLLFLGLMQGWPPRHAGVVWAGLASGSLVSLYLMHFGLWYAGWPLVAAVHLGGGFIRLASLHEDTAS
jgi:hypothetical protein